MIFSLSCSEGNRPRCRCGQYYWRPIGNIRVYNEAFGAGTFRFQPNPYKEGTCDYETWEKGLKDGRDFGSHLLVDHD